MHPEDAHVVGKNRQRKSANKGRLHRKEGNVDD